MSCPKKVTLDWNRLKISLIIEEPYQVEDHTT